ncbi:hypothetical protein [Kitasatospora sp. GAS1066B]|uniref:hypothetical protein n=1 Tax=Kitasatospora sp. GAS1066B TaxID=3156271 RepID=UPI003512EF03
MATSNRRRGGLPGWFGSRAHYLGSGAAVLGLGVSLAEGLGATGVAVVGGLYAAGAVLGVVFEPPQPVPDPEPDPQPEPVSQPEPEPEPDTELSESLERLAEQRERVALARWPEQGGTLARYLLDQLTEKLTEKLNERRNDTEAAPERPSRLVDAAMAALEHYERDLSWQRLEPGGRPPEEALAERVGELLDGLAPAAPPQR